VANSYTAPHKDFKIDANGARAFIGHFLCVEIVKGFVNVHLHCNVSNLKKISKMSTLLSLWKDFCGRPWLLSFTLLASFDVWASQANKLTMYEIEN